MKIDVVNTSFAKLCYEMISIDQLVMNLDQTIFWNSVHVRVLVYHWGSHGVRERDVNYRFHSRVNQSINQCLILINIPSCITEIYPQLSKLWTIFFNLYVFKYIFRLKIKNVQSHSMILIKKVFEFKLYIKVRWIIIFSERWRPPYLKFG